MSQTPNFRTEETGSGFMFLASGDWTVRQAAALDTALEELSAARARGAEVVFDLKNVTRLDTAGAWLIDRTAARFSSQGLTPRFEGLRSEFQTLFATVQANRGACPDTLHDMRPLAVQITARIGDAMLATGEEVRGLVGYFGVFLQALWRAVKSPRRLRLVPLIHHMEKAGFDALPIVCLITFLIGAVIAQQGAEQLKRFGADVYTVNLVAIIFLREVGILLTAIIVAGRSGSAFAAEIGSMKMREEIDAMRTLGLDPVEMLIVPRVLALVLTLPLLTFIADIMGLLGGAVTVWMLLDTTPGVFLVRLQEAAGFWTFGVGLLKAPFMAITIALIGCHCGMKVTGSAESVGQQTTQSVVKSIFMVIILDALFAMFFTAVGI
jgi:phospholipid/cholesterol/gamma-HCH transport system permease protein